MAFYFFSWIVNGRKEVPLLYNLSPFLLLIKNVSGKKEFEESIISIKELRFNFYDIAQKRENSFKFGKSINAPFTL